MHKGASRTTQHEAWKDSESSEVHADDVHLILFAILLACGSENVCPSGKGFPHCYCGNKTCGSSKRMASCLVSPRPRLLPCWWHQRCSAYMSKMHEQKDKWLMGNG